MTEVDAVGWERPCAGTAPLPRDGVPAGAAVARAELIEAFSECVPHHSHSVGLILLFLRLTLRSVLGFRGAASALESFVPLFPTDELAASPNGGQSWLLRLGLYELSRAQEQADDWVWIVDHTIQVGNGKCFVVVGVRMAAWEAKRLPEQANGALTHEDLSVWKIEVVDKSDGPTVESQLLELSRTTGQIPRAILSDCGGDLSAGIAGYCAANPATIALKDLPHFAANVLKRVLNDDLEWAAFITDANRAKSQLRQTKFAFLLPPDLKNKARWMNLAPLIAWSTCALAFVDSPRPVPGASWEAEELEAAMGWLRNHRSSLHRWSEMLDVVAASLKYIRKQGYHRNASQELRQALTDLPRNPRSPAEYVATSILSYVEEQSRPLAEGEHLLATSEILESLLGKSKQLQGRQSKSGFTKMILGIAASVSQLTTQTVTAALSTIRVRDVVEWIENTLDTSVQGQRYHALYASDNGTEIG